MSRLPADHCAICGWPDADHAGERCPRNCYGCERPLEEVAEGAAAGCDFCIHWLEMSQVLA